MQGIFLLFFFPLSHKAPAVPEWHPDKGAIQQHPEMLPALKRVPLMKLDLTDKALCCLKMPPYQRSQKGCSEIARIVLRDTKSFCRYRVLDLNI